jgi:geranylgeranyl pyrophosphate synthase
LAEYYKWIQNNDPGSKINKATAEYRLATEKALQEIYIGDSELSAAAAQVLYSGGKRIRPIITLLSCEAVCGSYYKAMPIAIAYELAHSASLIQDDVIDNSSLRRNQPTIQSRYGVTNAMLVSDYLLFCIFTQLAKYKDVEITKKDLARLLGYLGDSSKMTVIGEASKTSISPSKSLSEEDYLGVIGQKTAALFAAPAASGAIVAGAKENIIDAMHRFGYYFGLAFQVTDDLLDVIGSERETGKPAFSDLRNKSINITVIHALSKATHAQKNFIHSTDVWSTASGRYKMRRILKEIGSLEYSVNLAQKYSSMSRELLTDLPPSAAKDKLEELTRALIIS